MEHLQTLLPVLLLLCPLASTDYPWKWKERGGEAKAARRTHPTPYMAFLQGKDNHSCAGFLVAPGWVMTAAQCLMHEPLTVILGAHTPQSREESWQTFKVENYHSHPDFKISRLKEGNDILLLKLKGNATINDHVWPIDLDTSKKPLDGVKCRVFGWGHRRDNTVTLREATVTTVKTRVCLNRFPGLHDNVICGRSESSEVPEKDGTGDLLVFGTKAYGIFSYKFKSTGFYTHIGHFRSWVNSVLKSA